MKTKTKQMKSFGMMTLVACVLLATKATTLAQIVTNGGFETPVLPDQGLLRAANGPPLVLDGWTFSGMAGILAVPNYLWMEPQGWMGRQVSLLQTYDYFSTLPPGSFEQQITLPFSGIYGLTYLHGGRNECCAGSDGNQSYDVRINNLVVAHLATTSGQSFTNVSVTFFGNAGTNTLSFHAPTNYGDHTAFIDDVQVTLIVACIPHAATATATLTNGFVVGINLTDGGCGYTNAPLVRISGGGGSGATAIATMTNGYVTGIIITDGGIGYTNAPRVTIASPPFMPSVNIAVSKVRVTQHILLGHNYVLESSSDFTNWSQVGTRFTAEDELIDQEFDISATGRFFRILEVP